MQTEIHETVSIAGVELGSLGENQESSPIEHLGPLHYCHNAALYNMTTELRLGGII